MKHIFVINNAAGNGKFQRELKSQVEAAANKLLCHAECYFTTCPGDAYRFVKELPEGEKRVYACGGDGTLREVVNGLMARRREDESIGIVPCGTGNDFVRSFEGAENFLSAESQLSGTQAYIDLIKIDGEYCINMANVGFDANVAGKMSAYKKTFGKLAYEAALVGELFTPMKYRMKVSFDDGSRKEGNFLLLSAANGNAYGGGYRAAPLACLKDGLMDVCLVKRISRFQFLSIVGIYKKGEHLSGKYDAILFHKKCKNLTVTFDEPVSFCQDGEINSKDKAELSVEANAIKLVLPVGCSFAKQ